MSCLHEMMRDVVSFTAAWSSRKSFEFVSADVQCNDVLHLSEIEAGKRTGRQIIALVTHVEEYGVEGTVCAATKLLARLTNADVTLLPYTQGKRR